mmetsp:Transcript_124171/g.356727  ORF Transcript_124171/g.356727 Transcript_124171/m.356727 type:complete len:257 (-) Transcript_124171:969-1739(-)
MFSSDALRLASVCFKRPSVQAPVMDSRACIRKASISTPPSPRSCFASSWLPSPSSRRPDKATTSRPSEQAPLKASRANFRRLLASAAALLSSSALVNAKSIAACSVPLSQAVMSDSRTAAVTVAVSRGSDVFPMWASEVVAFTASSRKSLDAAPRRMSRVDTRCGSTVFSRSDSSSEASACAPSSNPCTSRGAHSPSRIASGTSSHVEACTSVCPIDVCMVCVTCAAANTGVCVVCGTASRTAVCVSLSTPKAGVV